MRKTLLLVFIHGFKGGDDTFGRFPEHVRALISHALPKIEVVAVQYPKFETKGELKDCVERFREWLQNRVIDIEVANASPSPTVDPSVHTVLVGHSMGGIVAAETLLLVANEKRLPSPEKTSANFASNVTTVNSTTGTSHPAVHHPRAGHVPSSPKSKSNTKTNIKPRPAPMFPQIVGLLAFDTPFLGLSPGVIAHGAEGHYKTASSAYNAFSELGSAFGWGRAAAPKSGPTPRTPQSPAVAASASASASPRPPRPPSISSPPAGLLTNGNGDAAASPRWQSWGKYAMFAGAAGAVAAGGAAALYSQREKLTSGWGWISGHLEFVGCLLRGEELRARVEEISALSSEGLAIEGKRKGEAEGEGGEEGEEEGEEERGKEGEGRGRGRVEGTGVVDSEGVKGNGYRGGVVFYSVLGRGANPNSGGKTGTRVLADHGGAAAKRTFCKLPPKVEKQRQPPAQQPIKDSGAKGKRDGGLMWIAAVNDKAGDEITAHTSMFYPRDNPGFYDLGEKAKEVVVGWIRQGRDGRDGEWYRGSQGMGHARGKGKGTGTGTGTGTWTWTGAWTEAGNEGSEAEHVWVHENDVEDDDDDVRMRDGSVDAEDLESSVVVDKARSGKP